jgi:hypothetical protein
MATIIACRLDFIILDLKAGPLFSSHLSLFSPLLLFDFPVRNTNVTVGHVSLSNSFCMGCPTQCTCSDVHVV